MDGTAYKDKEGNGEFKQSYCAYFDILGFKEKIKDGDLKYFDHYLSVLQKELKQVEFFKSIPKEKNDFEIKIFTDNFVIGIPWKLEDGEIELGTLFTVLSILQYNLLVEDIFIRGAVSASQLYMDENTVFGPALIDAYQLEEKSAIYPRIILSESIKPILLKHISYYAEGLAFQEEEFLKDSDGFLFINYLYHLLEIYNEPEFGDKKTYIKRKLNLHKDVIIKNLDRNKTDMKVFNKYSWVANYHNHFCKNYLDEIEGLAIGELLIPDDRMRISITKLTDK